MPEELARAADRNAVIVALIKAGGLLASAMCVSLTALIIVMYVYS